MLKKLCIIVGLCSVLTLLLVACGGATAGGPASNQVQMNDTQFMQSSITIKKGESITLVATTFTPHVIANGTWDNGQAKPASEPGAPTVKDMQVNGNSSSTIGPFSTAGTFKLYCTIHNSMNLTVIVR
jgi:plastocyanin